MGLLPGRHRVRRRRPAPWTSCGSKRLLQTGIAFSPRFWSNVAVRILALDHGTVRIGVAVSDELKMIASPLEYIPAEPMNAFLDRLRALVREKEVEQLVVGMPRNMDGSYGPAAEKVRMFVDQLKAALSVPVRTWDERLTSAQANRLLVQGNVRRQNRKQVVDKMAAAILLQSYLDSGAAGMAGVME